MCFFSYILHLQFKPSSSFTSYFTNKRDRKVSVMGFDQSYQKYNFHKWPLVDLGAKDQHSDLLWIYGTLLNFCCHSIPLYSSSNLIIFMKCHSIVLLVTMENRNEGRVQHITMYCIEITVWPLLQNMKRKTTATSWVLYLILAAPILIHPSGQLMLSTYNNKIWTPIYEMCKLKISIFWPKIITVTDEQITKISQ